MIIHWDGNIKYEIDFSDSDYRPISQMRRIQSSVDINEFTEANLAITRENVNDATSRTLVVSLDGDEARYAYLYLHLRKKSDWTRVIEQFLNNNPGEIHPNIWQTSTKCLDKCPTAFAGQVKLLEASKKSKRTRICIR